MSRDIKYIGMDVHKEAVVIAVLSGTGKLVMESIVETKASSILQFIHNGMYMEGFDPVQRGTVGDMTAGFPLGPWTEELAGRLKSQLEVVWQENGLTGAELEERRREVATDYAARIAAGELYYPYVQYPYLEWYSDNGRVVLELDPSQIAVIRAASPPAEKSPQELAPDGVRR